MYVCLFGITWEDNFRKTTRWKKRPYKSHTHISPFNQKIWFLKRCDMLLSFHQLKCPPPFQMPRIPGVFPWVVVATPYVWQQQPPSRDTSGTQAAWKASLAVGKWSTSRFQRWRQETHRETNPAIRWLKALNTEPKKNMTYTHCPLFFWWGGKGATEKKKGTNQTQNRTAFCHHHPVDMDSVFSPTSPNVPPAFCECVASQGELGGFSCKTTDIMRPSKNDNFLGLEAWSSTSPTRNHAITA